MSMTGGTVVTSGSPFGEQATRWAMRNTWALALSFSCLVWTVIIGLAVLI
jgi:hypothetical protein